MSPRKPTALKKLEGTHQKSRDLPGALDNTGIAPIDHPDFLDGNAVAVQRYYQLVMHTEEMGVISQQDDFMLAMLALRIDEVERCTAVLNIHGVTYETTTQSGDKMLRARPEVAMRNEAMRHAQSMLNDFGLSPAARSRVSGKSSKDDNPFNAF